MPKKPRTTRVEGHCLTNVSFGYGSSSFEPGTFNETPKLASKAVKTARLMRAGTSQPCVSVGVCFGHKGSGRSSSPVLQLKKKSADLS